MVYAYPQDVPIDEQLYRRILDELGPEPLAGSLLHLCIRRRTEGCATSMSGTPSRPAPALSTSASTPRSIGPSARSGRWRNRS